MDKEGDKEPVHYSVEKKNDKQFLVGRARKGKRRCKEYDGALEMASVGVKILWRARKGKRSCENIMARSKGQA